MMKCNRRSRFLPLAVAVIALLFLGVAFLLTALPTSREQQLYGRFIRLHVIAASDSDADQALKLSVRDAVLADVSSLMEGVTTVEDAKQILATHTDRLVSVASTTLQEAGCTDSVSVTFGEEYYPTRGYDSLRLPAGVYQSLQIRIGKAQGHNWWCVLFPPLCIRSAEPATQLAEAGLTSGQIRILTETENPRYVLKFRILEWLARWRHGD